MQYKHDEFTLFKQLESIQAMTLHPALFSDNIRSELELSDSFVDSQVEAYSLLEELTGILAGRPGSCEMVRDWWKVNGSRESSSEYYGLQNSEFERVVIHLVESAI